VNPVPYSGDGGITVSKLDATGSALLYSTDIGGKSEAGTAIAMHPSGDVVVTGRALPPYFPVVGDNPPPWKGSADVFVARFSPGGTIVYSTYLSGSSVEGGKAIAVDGAGYVYVTGPVASLDFPVQDAVQPANAGASDAFVVQLDVTPRTPVPPTITIEDRAVQEGGCANAAFRVLVSAPRVPTITVDYSTVDGTAIAGRDYTATSGTLTLSPGRLFHSIFVPILTDGTADGTKTFRLVLSNPANATLARGEAVGTIEPPPIPAVVPVYRAYNFAADYHFFTTSLGEYDNAVASGYRPEGIAYRVPNTNVTGTSALFRLYNPHNGRHYYTANAGERNILMGRGLVYEKDEGFIYLSAQGGTVEVFRLYNKRSGTHLYTTSAGERDDLLATFPGIWEQHASLGWAVP
jgi:hypothetical protein